MNGQGIILVSDDGIVVRLQQQDGTTKTTTKTGYTEPIIENLNDAARILTGWMDLSFEDTASECRRVHNNDQVKAFIRDIIDQSQPVDPRVK